MRNKIVSFGILAVLAVLVVLMTAMTPMSTADTSEEILLKSRQFVPDPGIDPSFESELWAMADAGVERAHVLMQFHYLPNTSEREVLNKDFGVELQAYIPNNVWFVDVPCGSVPDIVALPNVRWVGKILPDDKISPHIRNCGVGSWAVNPDRTVNLLVTFFGDVSNDEAIQVIEKYGSVVAEPSPWGGNVWTIAMNESDIIALAGEDAVKWTQEVAPPPTICNDGSRAAVDANTAQAPPYNLKGAGVVIGEWDGGWADWNHNDLSGRVTVGDTGSSIADHATHVAGTAMGDGTNSAGLLRGMAPEANLVTYEWPYSINELDSETNDAIVNYGAVISTNSWGWYIGSNCDLYGDYDDWSQNYDWIVDGKLGNQITIVFAAGNEEDNPWCQGSYPYPHPWGRMPGLGQTAKNTIVVGATYSDTNGHTCFSSRGPTDDGRIKPDVCAPGDEANDNPGDPCNSGDKIRSTMSGNEYGEGAGTSMAAPAVSGCAALIYQDYRSTHSGANPTPATVKALLIHTAEDLGNAGPDYTYGWGLINITAAVDVVRADNNPDQMIFEDAVSHSQVDTYNVDVPAGVELRVTLVWTDEKGEPGAAKELVNDLDLTITNGGTTHYPWLLDPDNPGSHATTGVDSINNVEQVVTGVSTGNIYTITVTGASVPSGPQPYSLVIGEGISTSPPSGDILLVDDDQGASYETYYKNALDASGYQYSYCSSPPDASVLSDYAVVIWLTGDDWTDTLTSTDQANLETYLNSGGSLFISGQDIGYDIGGTSFYTDYLHANYIQDYTGIYTLNGVTGCPIGDGLSIGISGGDGANNQNYQSEISPRDGSASAVFNYAGDGCGAIKADTGTYQVVYFAYGFEAINNAADRNTVMDRVMSWLDVSTGGPLWTRYSSRIDTETQCLGLGGFAIDSEDNVIIASNRDVIKYDSGGNLLWEYDMCGCGVVVDKTDDSVIVGLCNSSITKFSKTGSILWTRELQEDLYLSGAKSVNPSGDILVSGFGRVDGVFQSYYEIRDKNGNFIRSITRPQNGWWPSAAFAESGYIYLAYDLAQGVAIEKVPDDFSSTLWTATLHNCSQYVSAMGVDSENNLFARGTTGVGGVGYNQYTVKINGANGDLMWEEIYDSGYQDFGGGLNIDSANDVLVIGSTDYETGGKDRAGILMIKYDGSDGTELKHILYRKSPDDERFEVACGIVRDSNGYVYIGGKEYDISAGEGCGIETRRALTIKYDSI